MTDQTPLARTSSYGDRRILTLSGPERHDFLQGLVSNDVPVTPGRLVYGALLTPQGKYLSDFLMFENGLGLQLDVASCLFDATVLRLTMYRLRRDVQISAADVTVTCHPGARFADAQSATGQADTTLADPRHPDLGWRSYGPANADATPDDTDWDAIRVAHCIPQSGIELIPNNSYLLESGFERLNGIDFRKGCYVGQEINARMKHKTELKKGLVTVAITGSAAVGTPITADGKPVGTLFTQSGDRAIAFLRFDRAAGTMHAGDATVTYAG